MALESEVEGGLDTNVADSVAICFACLHEEEWGLVLAGCVLPGLTIHQDAGRVSDATTFLEDLGEVVMALGVPITNEDGVVVSWGVEGDWDEKTAIYAEATECACRLLHADGWVIKEAAYLILHLEVVRVVRPYRNRAVGPRHSVFPRVLPHLNSIPTRN